MVIKLGTRFFYIYNDSILTVNLRIDVFLPLLNGCLKMYPRLLSNFQNANDCSYVY